MQKVSFIIILSLLISLTSCGLFGKFKKIVSIIEANGSNHPNADYLINNIQSYVLNVAQTVPKFKIEKIGLLGVPSYAVEKFKAAIFAKDVVVNSFHFEISQGHKEKESLLKELVSLKFKEIKLNLLTLNQPTQEI